MGEKIISINKMHFTLPVNGGNIHITTQKKGSSK